MSDLSSATRDQGSSKLYRAIWRWHFYAGIIVVPFLIILATTGLLILWFTAVAPEYGEWKKLQPAATQLSVSQQIDAALKNFPGKKAGQYVTPWGEEFPALVRVDQDEGNRMLAVNPYTGSILQDVPQTGTWNEFLTNVHGELLIGGNGGPGDFVVEIAASLGVIMVVTGLFLWWPRGGKGFASSLVPRLSLKGRPLWRSLHESLGASISILLLFFLLSGLAWAGVWGGKFTQAWSTFPAEKWDAVPTSDATHASMNHGALKEVPWTLEQTPMPQSGSQAGSAGLAPGGAINFDTIVAFGRTLGFEGRFQIAAPADEKGVWTLSQDSMSYDSTNPTADRTVHIDQYTGKVLADVKFADYPFFGKVMAVGIALHEGQLGWWNVLLNMLYCLSVILMSVSGAIMWWKRKPAGAFGAPRYAQGFQAPAAILVIAVALSILFPLGGLAVLVFAAVDYLLPKKFKESNV